MLAAVQLEKGQGNDKLNSEARKFVTVAIPVHTAKGLDKATLLPRVAISNRVCAWVLRCATKKHAFKRPLYELVTVLEPFIFDQYCMYFCTFVRLSNNDLVKATERRCE